jgi:transcriptional regulator with XRE-family HTH domain
MLLREWRQRRRMSQLDLALEAEISQRHLSFVESGRAAPSREMVMRLAETLSVPLRQRNRLLAAAGFAPVFAERPIDDPGLRPALEAVQLVLKGHEPYPAIAVDRHWHMVAANGAIDPFLEGIPSHACWSRRSMSCASACIRAVLPRASSILANGATTSWSVCIDRSTIRRCGTGRTRSRTLLLSWTGRAPGQKPF